MKKFKYTQRLVSFGVFVTLGCNHEDLIGGRAVEPFQGTIVDMSVTSQQGLFRIEDFIKEVNCRAKETSGHVERLYSFEDLTSFIRAQLLSTVLAARIVSSSIRPLCHQECEAGSRKQGERNRALECTQNHVTVPNIHKCHHHCHKHPHSLGHIDFCLNCLVYYEMCPLAQHIGRYVKPNYKHDGLVETIKGIKSLDTHRDFIAELTAGVRPLLQERECASLPARLLQRMDDVIANSCSGENRNTWQPCFRELFFLRALAYHIEHLHMGCLPRKTLETLDGYPEVQSPEFKKYTTKMEKLYLWPSDSHAVGEVPAG